jgi:hypothetical protein
MEMTPIRSRIGEKEGTVSMRKLVFDDCNIIAHSLLHFFNEETSDLRTIVLKGGALLNLISTEDSSLSRLNDLDFSIPRTDTCEFFEKMSQVFQTITKYSDGIINLRLEKEKQITFRFSTCIELNPDSYPQAFMVFQFQIFGRNYKVEVAEAFTPSVDFSVNTMTLEFLYKSSHALFCASPKAVHDLLQIKKNLPISFHKIHHLNFALLSAAPEASHQILQALHRVIKMAAKGVRIEHFIAGPSPTVFCQICQDKSLPPLNADDPEVSQVRLSMKSLIISLPCSHWMCCHCYLTSWLFYYDSRLHNSSCGECRRRISFEFEEVEFVFDDTNSTEMRELIGWKPYRWIDNLPTTAMVENNLAETSMLTVMVQMLRLEEHDEAIIPKHITSYGGGRG